MNDLEPEIGKFYCFKIKKNGRRLFYNGIYLGKLKSGSYVVNDRYVGKTALEEEEVIGFEERNGQL
jgi:hypothetical protein